MTSAIPSPSVFDVNGLTTLKSQVKSDDPAALKAAAKQFEGMFLQMVLKSMRDTVPQDGMFDSEQTRMYQSMLDQQLALDMSNKGTIGLAAMIERQLGRKSQDPVPFENGLPLHPDQQSFPLNKTQQGLPLQHPHSTYFPLSGVLANARGSENADAVAAYAGGNQNGSQSSSDAAADFVARMRPHALAVEQASGIPAHFMVAQAALETGWGRAEPRFADGRPSFNLFGIKAGDSWKGNTVDANTLEYVGGQPQRHTERFRAYGSYAEAFADYAHMLTASPRYSAAAASRDGASFARALQSAGYATDPQYADKLERIISSPAIRNLQRG